VADSLDILLVEDNAGDRALVRHLLPAAHVLREVATAAAARRALAERRPDLALLDYALPDADGLALLPDFAAADVPVVMLTGIEAADLVVEAMRAGAQHYLLKAQLTPEALEHAIGHVAAKAALERSVAEQQRMLAVQAAALEAKNREISALASALTLAEQAERRRLADVLHDGIQQLLFGAKLALGGVLTADGRAEQARRVDAVEGVLDQAIAATRSLALELTPPVLDREDLGVAVEWLAHHMGEHYGIEVEVQAPAGGVHVPSRALLVLLLQLLRELLFNVVKHAGVGHTQVRVEARAGQVLLRVSDEGRGFDPEALVADGVPRGFGLYSVRERLELLGGGLRVESSPGAGTRVTISAPLPTGTADGGVPRP